MHYTPNAAEERGVNGRGRELSESRIAVADIQVVAAVLFAASARPHQTARQLAWATEWEQTDLSLGNAGS